MHAVKSPLLGILVASLAANALAGAPEYGIASRYLRDVGIENDPHVVFTENFESGSVDELVRRWGCTACYTWPEHMSFASDVPATSGGQRSYRSDGPTDLYKLLKPKDGRPGFEKLYVRFYSKFDSATCQVFHHWPWLGGHDPPTGQPSPRAGSVPNDEGSLNTAGRFSSGVEQYAGTWDFYTYWPEMKGVWGNSFNAVGDWGQPSPFPIQYDRWFSLELMVKLNDFENGFGLENGEQAFWLDGELKSYVGGSPGKQLAGKWRGDAFVQGFPGGTTLPGIRWRTTRPNLMINYFWLEHFVDTDPGQDCVGWFDDVVISTEYIGPMVTQVTDAGTVTPVTDGGPPTSATDGGANNQIQHLDGGIAQQPPVNAVIGQVSCSVSSGNSAAALMLLLGWLARRRPGQKRSLQGPCGRACCSRNRVDSLPD